MKLKKKKNHITFDKRMIRFISVALIISTSLIISVSAVSTVISLTNKSAQMATKEVEAMASNTEDNFGQYHGLIWSIILDDHIQDYFEDQDNQYGYINEANSILENICNMWENINFISIVRNDGSGFLIKGNSIPNWMFNYKEKIQEDYENGISMKDNGMTMLFTKEYSAKGEYTLNIYYPLYSNTMIGRKLGTMCINIDDSNLLQLVTNASGNETFVVDTYFIHKDGKIISSTDTDQIYTEFDEKESMKAEQITSNWGNLIIYKALSGWDFYYVTRIGWWELLRDSVWTVVTLGVLLAGLIIVIIRLAKKMVTKAYEPWGNVVKSMGQVSKGELDTRLQVLERDPDMQVVSNGFNSMMEQIIKLMDQVKEEQYQIDQIRLEALHSQIQPHFLYNTLDCIHWQAVVSGNQDISNLVKALASYYRICLSKGKDIITIREELEYIKNYLYIQRMRYGEILNYEIISEPGLEEAMIPKLTLQPLVENAIYHGIKLSDNQEGNIKIQVSKEPSGIQIEIEDSGPGMTDGKIEEINQMISIYDEQFGYGVRNVNRRIELYYGKEYGLTYQRNEQGGVTVKVLLPDIYEKKKGEQYQDEGTNC